MLGKLLGYDLRALTRILGPIHLVAIAVIIMATLCGLTGYWLDELIVDSLDIVDIISVSMMLGVGSGVVVLACLVPATFVVVIHRFYANLFTDQGYLTLTLPVRASEIVWAKVIAGFLWLVVSMIVVSGGSILLAQGIGGMADGFDFADSLPYWMMRSSFGWGYHDLPDALIATVGTFLTLLSALAALLMGYAGFTLGATLARQHKVACGIALTLGLSWIVSTFSGTIDLTATLVAPDYALTLLLQAFHFIRDVILCAGYLCITLYCLSKRVNLR